MSLLSNFYQNWQNLMDKYSDPRTSEWPLMSSPFPTIWICILYVYCVKVFGPNVMKNRKPFKLKYIIILYNLAQVMLSFYLFWEGLIVCWLFTYNWRCEPVDYSRSETAMRIARGCYVYYISKFTEFFDTFFFIARKRFDQVSTLHVIHHGIMPFSVWWGVKFIPGGHSTFFGFLNTFVHIVMYLYYMMAAFGPEMQKYLWWKKYLTILQMIQFVAVGIHSFQLFFHNPCNYPMGFAYFIGAHAIMFFVLFFTFFRKTYVKKKSQEFSMKSKSS